MIPIKLRRKRLFTIILSSFALVLLLIFICNKVINDAAEGKLYANARQTPYNKVGLLLGTAKYLDNGWVNIYYAHRINATLELFRAGKIRYLVISGDNGRKTYNEPEMMRADLMRAGIDSTRIFLDYAGFRTFDSMVRLRDIFGQNAVTVISQPFHNERAIYIASQQGISAIGFNAKDAGPRAGLKVQARELLARVKLFADELIGTRPRFGGPKVIIP